MVKHFRMKNGARVVLVALLLVLAGCTGVIPDSGQNNEGGNKSLEYLAPGLTDDGVTNRSLLIKQHFAILENRSGDGTYVAKMYSNTSINGTLADEAESRHIVQYPEKTYNIRTERNHTGSTIETTSNERWYAQPALLVRSTMENQSVNYQSRAISSQPHHPVVLEEQVEVASGMVSAEYDNVAVEERTQNGTTWYVVTNEVEEESSNAMRTATVHIREDGLLMRVDETISSKISEGEGRVDYWGLEFEITPNETLVRPDWYEEALEATADE